MKGAFSARIVIGLALLSSLVVCGCHGVMHRNHGVEHIGSPASWSSRIEPPPEAASVVAVGASVLAPTDGGSSTDAAVPEMSEPPALLRQLRPIGSNLAAAADQPDLHFEFSTLADPIPGSYHCAGGHVYVSTGMLRVLDRQEDLAAVLALEIAGLIAERDSANRMPFAGSMPSAGPNDEFLQRALAAKEGPPIGAPARRQVERLARKLLRRAGYSSVDFAEMRMRIESRGAGATTTTSASDSPNASSPAAN